MSAPLNIVTRFAPSPTGFLHIGGARTALFNWLFARHHGGTCRLRIEDTDHARSTQDAVDKIMESLHWMGLKFDGEVVFQSQRLTRHQEVAHTLHASNNAYYCTCTPDELTHMREHAKLQGLPQKYDGRCRNKNKTPSDKGSDGSPPVLRIKIPEAESLTLHDAIQGDVTIRNAQLDDMIILRSDGTPTYMLSVVVDDHDMGVTHIIRGDDHLTNAFRQHPIYTHCGWSVPTFAHIPLIHGEDGAKLSKRHGALGAEHYRDEGFLPEAMQNYLLRLGFAHGDEEVIPTSRAIDIFTLSGVGKSPARFDIKKLTHLNGHYIRTLDNVDLARYIKPFLKDYMTGAPLADDVITSRITAGMDGLKQRAKTLKELAFMAAIYIRPHPRDEKAITTWAQDKIKNHRIPLIDLLNTASSFEGAHLEQLIRDYATEHDVKLGDVAQTLRIALTGCTISPSVFEVMEILGRDDVLTRLNAAG